MAFMMPVVKKDWEIYPTKPTRSRQNSTSTGSNHHVSAKSKKSQADSLSTSPRSMNEYVPPSVRNYHRSESADSSDSNGEQTPTIQKSSSSSSFVRLVEKIRRRIRSKDSETDSDSTTDVTGRSPV